MPAKCFALPALLALVLLTGCSEPVPNVPAPEGSIIVAPLPYEEVTSSAVYTDSVEYPVGGSVTRDLAR